MAKKKSKTLGRNIGIGSGVVIGGILLYLFILPIVPNILTHEEAVIVYSIPIEPFPDPDTGVIIEPEPPEEFLPETELTYLEQLLEDLGISFTSEFGIVNTATIFDTNGDVIDERTQLTALSILDPQGNLLDLAIIQFKFDAITQQQANIIADATIELSIDNIVVESRQLKINANTIENIIPFEVRGGGLGITENTFNFTLAERGTNWADGSLHELILTVSNIEAQVSTGAGLNEFSRTEPIILYKLELLQDEERKTIVGESGEQISIPKDDDIISISSNSPFTYANSCDNSGCTGIHSHERTTLNVIIKDSEGNIIDELITPECSSSGTSNRQKRSNVSICKEISENNFSRFTNYFFEINALIGGGDGKVPLIVMDNFNYTTPETQQNMYIHCEMVHVSVQRCGSNIGWSFP